MSHMLPFNIEIMKLDARRLSTVRPVTSLDYYERVNGDLHEDGLFSVAIFGRIGDEMRDKRFSYIDIKVEVFHPVIYETLVKIKALYRGILAGSQYAAFDEELKDFVPANELEGKTGFAFFMSRFNDIEFKKNKSIIRDKRIELIEKYKDRATVDKILVMPAGLRDIEVDETGQKKVGEINAAYRKVLSIAKTIPDTTHRNSDLYNLPRHLLQMSFNEIYESIEKILRGKKGFFQHRWGRRRIYNGTRNVITAMDSSKSALGDPLAPRFTDSVIGLYQCLKATQPVAIHAIRNKYLPGIFNGNSLEANLVEPTNWKRTQVTVESTTYDKWMSVEGLEKVLTAFGEASTRHLPIKVDGYYMALIYAPKDRKVFKVFHSIEDLPSELSKDDVHPITYVEFLYLSAYYHMKDKIALVTRYPVTGIGSIYPSSLYIKTTINGERRVELNDHWEEEPNANVFPEFPVFEPLTYMDSFQVHSTRLARLGGDFDGDTVSVSVLMTDEGLEEIKRFMGTREAWVDPRGGMVASVNVDTVALVLKNMTRPPTK